MSELLSIAIPTRNRAPYLLKLLNSIENQVKQEPEILNDLRIYVFDNASDDHTGKLVRHSHIPVKYMRNRKNIGGSLNILQAYTVCEGSYVWVIGDDELSGKHMLARSLKLLKRYRPNLVINRNNHWWQKFEGFTLNTFTDPWVFQSYREFALECMRHHRRLILAHSLISLNIILKTCFDADFALEKLDTDYGQFYGMVKGLKDLPGTILFPRRETIVVRKKRAGWVDHQKPADLHGKQKACLEWLLKEYNL